MKNTIIFIPTINTLLLTTAGVFLLIDNESVKRLNEGERRV